MDYNLTRTVQGRIGSDLNVGMPFGEMPPNMLIAKFEETDIGDEEGRYDDYARGLLTDHTPDTNKFEHEEPRGGVSRRSGRLQLQYNGTRGCEDVPYRPETFDGFAGPEDQDPRGINVEPDMKELRRQETARMRFINLAPDAADQITGGGRSESTLMADQQKLNRVVRDRLKIFDRQIDGRRNGKSTSYEHKSNVAKQVRVQSYGDSLKDYALTPQRRANIVCREVLRDTRAFRDQNSEADLATARYSQLCRRARNCTDHNRAAAAQDSLDGKEAPAQDSPKYFKSAGLLMSNIIRGKKQSMSQGDIDMTDNTNTIARKTAPFSRDLALIMHAMVQDSEFASGDASMIMKTAMPVMHSHLARTCVYNHSTPAHHLLNAEVLYKSVKPGADLRQIRDQVVTDASTPDLRDTNTISGKVAKMKRASGARLCTADDTDKSESVRTINYKTLVAASDTRVRTYSADGRVTESDLTQNRRSMHTQYRVGSTEDTIEDMRYGDNACKERHTRGLGSKYLNRHIDRDAQTDEISQMN